VEWNVSVVKPVRILFLLLVGWFYLLPAVAGEPRLVMVASAQSQVSGLSPASVRRLYLGVPLVQDGHEIVPLRNSADPIGGEVFLQRVLFMSAQAYERQISGRVFRSGGQRLAEHPNLARLVDELLNNPWSVTYMSPETAASLPGLRLIGEL
jgi:hypothetical protein